MPVQATNLNLHMEQRVSSAFVLAAAFVAATQAIPRGGEERPALRAGLSGSTGRR